jgi:hypothetical protein
MSSSVPPRRTATAVVTGTPSSAERRSRSIVSPPGGDVDHVEDEQQRPPDLLELDREAQRQAQVGGVGDAQEEVGRRLGGEAAEHDVARHLLVEAARAQRIGSGQIDQLDAAAGRRADRAGLALDGGQDVSAADRTRCCAGPCAMGQRYPSRRPQCWGLDRACSGQGACFPLFYGKDIAKIDGVRASA